MSKADIPSSEDFARAKAAMRRDDQGLDEVRRRMLDSFGRRGIREIFAFFSRNAGSFGIYVFFESDLLLQGALRSGMDREIELVAMQELERVGRGPVSSLSLSLEFDSHENVERNYNGNYYHRLR